MAFSSHGRKYRIVPHFEVQFNVCRFCISRCPALQNHAVTGYAALKEHRPRFPAQKRGGASSTGAHLQKAAFALPKAAFPLFHLRQKILDVFRGHRPVCRGRNDLPQGLCAHVAHRKYARKAGAGGLIRLHIPLCVQFHLAA